MSVLAQQRCFNHSLREAAARCPECGHFFCRECITEHDDRVVCTSCLKKLLETPHTRRRAFAKVLPVAQCAFGIFLVWFLFFMLGDMLLRLPDSFHEGTVWKTPWVDKE